MLWLPHKVQNHCLMNASTMFCNPFSFLFYLSLLPPLPSHLTTMTFLTPITHTKSHSFSHLADHSRNTQQEDRGTERAEAMPTSMMFMTCVQDLMVCPPRPARTQWCCLSGGWNQQGTGLNNALLGFLLFTLLGIAAVGRLEEGWLIKVRDIAFKPKFVE